LHNILQTMVKRHNDRVEELENVLSAETGIKVKEHAKARAPPPPTDNPEPIGDFRRGADSSDYNFDDPHKFPLVGNGLGATVWPDRQGGVGSLYDTLKMSAIRLWIEYVPDLPPECPDVTREIMDAYWSGYAGDEAASAARNAKDHGAEVLIIIKKPPRNWRFLLYETYTQLIDSPECRRAVALFWGSAVKRFLDLGMEFKWIELFNEPECVYPWPSSSFMGT
jgi:hypothetical protein